MLWKAQNKKVFEKDVWDPFVVANLATARFWEFLNVQLKCKPLISPLFSIVSYNRWNRPLHTTIKCNVDASFSKSSQLGGGGAVFRNSADSVLQAVIFKPSFSLSVLEAKAYAFRRAVYWAKVFKFQDVCFESDAKVVVEALAGVRSGEGAFASLVSVMRKKLQDFPTISLMHVRRVCNQVAHALAGSSCAEMEADLVLQSKPSSILKFLEEDVAA
ncbi:uncharacterized protein LOC132309404 [Cornus florida]|uniref:uncharacterized protein LOC132309404 n=1 Tax=Cornus florida TaxID=4283 RepID=UPI0028A13C51|nr:uncharacterized protein LOC132309404 [Cornus florida]